MEGVGYIFISYSSADADFALKFAADLKSEGINVWIDRLDIHAGDDWRKMLQTAVDGCIAMIPITSPNYVASKYCVLELARAHRLGRQIFPVVLRHVPSRDWPMELELHQYIDFSQAEDEHSYRKKLAILVTTLRQKISVPITIEINPETRYLTNLIARMEIRKGLLEYLDLAVQRGMSVDQQLRPRPQFANLSAQSAFTVWHDLSARQESTQRGRSEILSGIYKVVEQYPRLILIGSASAGKTITLHQLALSLARARLASPDNHPIPMMLKLSSWGNESSAEEWIRARWSLDTDPIKLLAKGKAVLFLDGLDEMGQTESIKVRLLRDYLNGEAAPQRVVITCRAENYGSRLDLGLTITEACAMDAAHIEDFVHAYLGIEGSSDLLKQLLPGVSASDRYVQARFKLAQNPFLLGTLILLHSISPADDLPYTCGGALKRLVDEMWKLGQLSISHLKVSFEELEMTLIDLALAMFQADMPIYVQRAYAQEHLGSAAVVEAALKTHLLEGEGEYLRFSNQLLQQYFAAAGLMRDGIYTLLTQPQFDPRGHRIPTRWDDIILTLVGFVPQPEITIQAVSEVDPYLALLCTGTGVDVSEQSYQESLQRLYDAMQHEDGDGRLAAAKVLGQLDIAAAVPLLIDVLRDGHWEMRIAAHDLLLSLNIPPLQGLRQALIDPDYDFDKTAFVLLGQLKEIALPTLLFALHDEEMDVRRRAVWALGEIQDKAAVPGLVRALHDENNLVIGDAISALGWMRDTMTVMPLQEMLYHENLRLRKTAVDALRWIGAPAYRSLLRGLDSGDDHTRKLVVEALREIPDAEMTKLLIETSYHENVVVRMAALEALRGRKDSKTMKRLIEALEDYARSNTMTQRICDLAAALLLAMGLKEASEAVERWRRRSNEFTDDNPKPLPGSTIEARPRGGSTAGIAGDRLRELIDKNGGSRPQPATPTDKLIRTLKGLRDEKPETALSILRKHLHHEDPEVRKTIIKVASLIPHVSAVTLLLLCLDDDDFDVSALAGKALSDRKESSVVPGLIKSLESRNKIMRATALEALGRIGDPQSIDKVAEMLADESKLWLSDGQRICDFAAAALKGINTPKATKILHSWRQGQDEPKQIDETPTRNTHRREIFQELLDALHQNDWHAQQDAAKALRDYAKTMHKTKDPVILNGLLGKLEDPQWRIRWAAVEALAWIANPESVPALTRLLKDSNWTLRAAVVRALIDIGDVSAVPALIGTLKDANATVREAAVEALGILGSPEAIPHLAEAMSDGEPIVRLRAVMALGQIQSNEVENWLLQSLKSREPILRWAAAEALTKAASSESVNELIPLLQDGFRPDWLDTRPICDLIAEALQVIGTPEALEALEKWRKSQV